MLCRSWPVRLFRGFFILLFLSTNLLGFGQSFQVAQYTIEEGLTNNLVHDATQDSLGRMWFATSNGIAVYDGMIWEKHLLGVGDARVKVSQIEVDEEQRIWAMEEAVVEGNFYLRLHLFSRGQWQVLEDLPIPDKAHRSYFPLTLFRYHDQIRPAVGIYGRGIFLWNGDHWVQFSVENGLPCNEVNALEGFENQLYIGTDQGLFLLKEDQTVEKITLNENSPGVLALYLEKSNRAYQTDPNRLWAVGSNWMGTWDGSFALIDGQMLSFENGHQLHRLVQPDFQGGVFISDVKEIRYYNLQTKRTFPVGRRNDLVADGVNAFFCDREGNFWLCQYRGVSKISSKRFTNYDLRHGLFHEEVASIEQLAEGKLVFGHNKGYSIMEDGKITAYTFGKEGGVQRVMDLCKVRPGEVYAAVTDLGIARIAESGSHQWVAPQKGRHIYSSLAVDSLGEIWVSSYSPDSPLYQLKDEKLEKVPIPSKHRFPIRKLFVGPDNALYCAGMHRGVGVYKNGVWQHDSLSGGGAVNQFYAVAFAKSGQALVGGVGGLYAYGENGLSRADLNGVQLNEPIYFLDYDVNDHLWLGTEVGTYKWNGKSLSHYSIEEGLAGRETNRDGFYADKSGEVWIGTESGVSCYREEFDRLDTAKPHLYFQELDVAGARHPLEKEIELKNNENTLTFHYVGVSFLDEDRLVYQCKLGGLETSWQPAEGTKERSMRYTNLASGEYQFHVRARNATGQWSPVLSSSKIHVLPPFWLSWWFLLISLLFIAICAVGVYLFFAEKTKARRYKEELEDRLVQILENTSDLVGLADKDGMGLYLNKAGRRMMGVDESAQVPRIHFSEYHPPEEIRRLKEEILPAAKKQGSWSGEVAFLSKTGEVIPFLQVFLVHRNRKGEIINFSTVARNISQMKRDSVAKEKFTAQLASKNTELERISSMISHELITPINGIYKIGQWMREDLRGNLDLKTAAQFDLLEIRTKRLKNYIDSILEYANIGKPESTEEVAIESIIDNLSSGFDLDGRGVLKVEGNLPTVHTSRILIYKVFSHLIQNALIHNESRDELKITIGATDIGEFYQFYVKDNGAGIDPKYHLKIFEAFRTLEARSDTENLGVGLAIVHKAVEKVGGEIFVDEDSGAGFCIKFTWPKKPLQG